MSRDETDAFDRDWAQQRSALDGVPHLGFGGRAAGGGRPALGGAAPYGVGGTSGRGSDGFTHDVGRLEGGRGGAQGNDRMGAGRRMGGGGWV